MRQAALVLIAVAKELSEMAKRSLPVLRKGETVQREWFKDATLYRETVLNGQRFIAEFNFRQRKSRRMLVGRDSANV
ncbi:MAG: hypothetical protein IJ587_07740 [Synergistaceae bacterium]|nr:hypothetical protein [Synergistaceae bacterium]